MIQSVWVLILSNTRGHFFSISNRWPITQITIAKEAKAIAKYAAQIEAMRQSLKITINPVYLAAARKVADEAKA